MINVQYSYHFQTNLNVSLIIIHFELCFCCWHGANSFFSLCRYFLKELLPLGVIKKAHLPLYLNSWSGKASLQYMYTSA
jgi:hypothetical protein